MSKIINSIKIDPADYGKFMKTDASGNLVATEVDLKAKKVTGHPTGITQDTNGTYTYTIADFDGPDIVTDNIRKIYILIHSYPRNGGTDTISATMPWDPSPVGEFHVIYYNYMYVTDHHWGDAEKILITIPINKDQESFSININSTVAFTGDNITIVAVDEIVI